MKKTRDFHSLIYLLICTLAFIFSYRLVFQKNILSWQEYVLVITVAIIDILLLEGARDIYRLSRMKVLTNWLIRSFFIYLFFFLIQYKEAQVILSLWPLIQEWFTFFSILVFIKLLTLSYSSYRLKNKKIVYDTILIGSDAKTQEIYNELQTKRPSMGQNFLGSIGHSALKGLPHLGSIEQLEKCIIEHQAEEVIISLAAEQYHELSTIIHRLRTIKKALLIRITPESYDFLMGHIKMNSLYNAALIELSDGKMAPWQALIKRVADVLFSFIILLILSPLMIWILVQTKRSSPGPILYRQSRIGRYGVPFFIIKFRSMYIHSEEDGPRLSQNGDTRCTPWGTFMRKWRLDEIPQFWNVLVGEMSIVGPRPERQFYIDQIQKIAPYYARILTVRPGITSWGQVKYGYASNIIQMVERLKFDLIYVENLSLALDIKIILYTILVLFQGKGK